MIGVGLLFGYVAGILTRLFVRPWICFGCLALSVGPALVSTLLQPDTFHILFLFMSLIMLVAAAESMLRLSGHVIEELELRHELAYQAERDALTGLRNRRALYTALERDIARTNSAFQFAIHLIDLDRFKAANDRHGHQVGDQLLCEVGKRLSRAISSSDLVARMGGDEFVVVQRNISSAGEPELLARRIVKSISAVYRFGGIEVSIGASVGVSISKIDGATPTELLAKADQAMYLSKTKQLGYSMASINALTNLVTEAAGYLEGERRFPEAKSGGSTTA